MALLESQWANANQTILGQLHTEDRVLTQPLPRFWYVQFNVIRTECREPDDDADGVPLPILSDTENDETSEEHTLSSLPQAFGQFRDGDQDFFCISTH